MNEKERMRMMLRNYAKLAERITELRQRTRLNHTNQVDCIERREMYHECRIVLCKLIRPN